MEPTRHPAVAGSFYPADASELGACLEDCFHSSPLGPRGFPPRTSTLMAGMVPHAGYVYSGPCAAHFYSRLDENVERAIVLGVNHRGRGHRAALSPAKFWNTPIGAAPVDTELNDELAERLPFLSRDELAHRQEHSIEVQVPFLQRVLREFAFVPISLSRLPLEECAQLGRAIAALYKAERRRTLIIASSDLSHYLSPQETNHLDELALEKVLARDAAGLLDTVARENITMCGVIPTAVMLFAVNALGAKDAVLLKHCHSGEVTPMSEVVGYASVAISN